METKMNEASNQPLKSGHTVECRICLQMVQNRMFTDVFAPWIPFSSHDETTVAAELANIAGIEIPENDNQQYICKKCTSRLSSALQFIVEVRQSDQILKQRELETQNLKEKWPKPIQLEKNINEEIRGNTMDVEIKEEVKSDDELEVHEDGVHDGDSIESVSIKVEPEDTVDEEPSFQITVNGTTHKCRFKRILVLDMWLSFKSDNQSERCRRIFQTLSKLLPDIKNLNTSNLKKIIITICESIKWRWRRLRRSRSRIVARYGDWLNAIVVCDLSAAPAQDLPSASIRLGKEYQESSKCTIQQKFEELSNVDSSISSVVNEPRFNTSFIDFNTDENNDLLVRRPMNEASICINTIKFE